MQSINELVKFRMLLKGSIDDKTKEMKLLVEEEKRKLGVIESAILQYLNESGLESVKTEHGSAYKDLKESFTVEDREQYFDWVRETGNWEFLSASVSSPNAKQFVSENGGALPPGVKYSAFLKTKYRKPTKK